MLEIRLLGPLEVVDGDRVLTPHRQKPRALAVLALRAGRHVSKDLLVELIWGQDSPRRAIDALENYVSQLRKLLGRDAIGTRPGGYQLQVSPEEVDVTRFERLIAEARAAEPLERAEGIRAALTLFRGPPLADLAYEPFAPTEIGRLEELELTAREDLVDAELEVGRHADVVPDLEVLIAGHPYRERPRAQPMLALYRAGRQAEALEVFHEARRLLVDELGLEPGAELQELERAILRQDEALRPPARVERAAGAAAPAARLAPGTAKDCCDPPSSPELRRSPSGLIRSSCEWCSTATSQRRAVRLRATEASSASRPATPWPRCSASRPRTRTTCCAPSAPPSAREAVAALNDEPSRARACTSSRGPAWRRGGPRRRRGAPDRSRGRPRPGARLCRARRPDPARRGAAGCRAEVATLEPAEAEAALRLVELLPGADGRALRLDAPLVGRARQVSALHAAFDAAVEERSCRLFTVLGVAGVGKSRLVQELVEDVEEGAAYLRARCLPYGEGITYLPLHEVPAAAAEDVDWSAPPAELFQGARAVLEGLARASPLVLVLDDIHWAEPALLDLVEDVVRTSRGVAMLVVCLARPELLDERPGWGGGLPNASSLLLEPLGEADTERLLDHLLGASDLPDPVRSYIVGASEGNLLFLEEMLASLVESDVLQRRSGRWTTMESVIRVPPSISALIAARIDRLADEDRHLLELASVEGVQFSRDVLAEVVPRPCGPTFPTARHARPRELVRPDEAAAFASATS